MPSRRAVSVMGAVPFFFTLSAIQCAVPVFGTGAPLSVSTSSPGLRPAIAAGEPSATAIARGVPQLRFSAWPATERYLRGRLRTVPANRPISAATLSLQKRVLAVRMRKATLSMRPRSR